MEDTNNIIAIRKKNISQAHEAFVSLMGKTEAILNTEAKGSPEKYRKMDAKGLESCAFETIKSACSNTPFDANEVQLISGQRFPDIVANTYYGIEVKSTKENKWISTGSSIVETTRVEHVDDIYMLFGKLGGNPEFKCRPYQDVLYDIAVTHSPRYLINMEIGESDTIFAKMGTTYDDFRLSEDSIAIARKYYREKALQQHKQEMPWWISSNNIEQPHSFNVKLWNSLNTNEKRELRTKCMILFPEVLSPKQSPDKYNNSSLWLCSCCQVVNPNIRDSFSAGGKITHVNGHKLQKTASQVFNVIVEHSNDVRRLLKNPSADFYQMIKEYNPRLLSGSDPYKEWLKICIEIADKNDVPLMKWIKDRPQFTFSK